MAFIDDAFFELPDVATEGEAEGGGSQSQYSQQSQGGESEGSQSSQGSRRGPRRSARWRNHVAADRFMDRLRFELLLGHSGGETREHPTTAKQAAAAARGATTKCCPTAQQSQDRASNHPRRAIRTMTVRRTTNSQ